MEDQTCERRWDTLQNFETLFCADKYLQLLGVYTGIISDSWKNVPGF